MGRVSAKRKLKQCDPFFKGKRDNGKKQTTYDLPPTQSKRSKKRRRKILSDDAMEQYVMRTSAVNDDGAAIHSKKKQLKMQVGSIRENETMREFNKRISTEVKRVIYDAAKQGRRSSEKRKMYLAMKKDKRRDKTMTQQERYERDYQITGNTKKDYFEDAAPVHFGERVDAPPLLPKLSGIFKKRADQLAREKAKVEKEDTSRWSSRY